MRFLIICSIANSCSHSISCVAYSLKVLDLTLSSHICMSSSASLDSFHKSLLCIVSLFRCSQSRRPICTLVTPLGLADGGDLGRIQSMRFLRSWLLLADNESHIISQYTWPEFGDLNGESYGRPTGKGTSTNSTCSFSLVV